MAIRKRVAGCVIATAVTGGAMFGAVPAGAQTQEGVAIGGLVSAIVQAQNVNIVEVEDVQVNVDLQNVLNRNRVLTNFLNNNNINVEDVVDIQGNTIFVDVL